MQRKYLRELQERLKAERKRLKFSRQADFAAAIGMPERTYWEREAGDVMPDAEFFARFRELGGDVQFVICGEKTTSLGVMQTSAPYTPAQHLAAAIQGLNLAEEDAAAVLHIANRLAH